MGSRNEGNMQANPNQTMIFRSTRGGVIHFLVTRDCVAKSLLNVAKQLIEYALNGCLR